MTKEQLLASDPSLSAWVSASAGTGKTKVLTDRVLRLLLTGERPGAILCITFTKAAAAEMLERIEQELGHWAVADDAELKTRLKKLSGTDAADEVFQRARRMFAFVMDAPDKLRVQTIHSFCQSVIARFPIEAGVSPHITVLDEYDANEMLEEARARLFRESGRDDKTSAVLRSLARTIAESTLQDVLAQIVSARRKFSPLLSLQGGAERFTLLLHEALGMPVGMNETKLLAKHFTYRDEELATLKHAIAILSTIGGATNLGLANTLATWLERRADAELYAQSFFTLEGKPRQRLYTKDVAEKHPQVAEVIAQEFRRAEGFLDEFKTLRVIGSTQQMMLLARIVLGHYAEEKTRHGVMDFDDLIMHTVNLFKRSGAAAWVLYKLDSGLNHLLVDEAQDTSAEQWEIVEALVEEFFAGSGARNKHRTLFVVGDEKQSIYSFQGADPHLFDRMRLDLSKKARDADMRFEHIRLDTSFRSTEAVLKAVDTVFASDAARKGLVFSEFVISHKAFREKITGRVELWPLLDVPKREKVTIWDNLEQSDYTPSAEQQLAEAIATEIAGWLKEKRVIAGRGRAVEPGDIMILVRRRGRFAEAMIRSLKRKGVAVAGADRLLITDHIAVMDCMALATFLLQPEDNLTLAALLKSPFVGLNDDDLFRLCHGREKLSLWQRLKQDKASEHVVTFLSEMLSLTDYFTPYELLSHALVTLGKRKAIYARLGAEADDPLNEFLSLALHYEQSHPPSLQGFLHWIKSNETEIKRDMDKARNEVRILTVHASKGLQAPIIFMPDTTGLPQHPDNLQWMQTMNGPMLPLWTMLSKQENKHLKELKELDREESLDEYRRLLYVAMTRAQDELYICGWKGDKALSKGSWYELIENALKEDAAWQDVNERKMLLLGDAQGDADKKAALRASAKPMPAWVNTKPTAEKVPSKPLSPSKLTEEGIQKLPHASQAARLRGVLVHRLLQYLPQCAASERDAVMQRFIAHYGEGLNERERSDIARQVMALLQHPDFSEVFSEHSAAEVPLVGVVEDAGGAPVTVAGQIDRLAVLGDEVLIVDFKTGAMVPEDSSAVPTAYRKQLGFYRKLVQKIYPDKTVRCAIIWTSTAKLMQMDGL